MPKEHDKVIQSCPCKDCVSYAICRTKIRSEAAKAHTNQDAMVATRAYFNIGHLLTKCSIFNSYVDIHVGITYDTRYRLVFDVLKIVYGVYREAGSGACRGEL